MKPEGTKGNPTQRKKQATKATTVKSSKSNTSDRMGGGGGKGTSQRAYTRAGFQTTMGEVGKTKAGKTKPSNQ
jgi:hypothetical protein